MKSVLRFLPVLLATLVATSLPLVTPSNSEAAPWSTDTVLFYDSYGGPTKAYGNFIPGTTVFEPGPPYGTYSPSVWLAPDGTYCFEFTLHAYSSVEPVFIGEENASGERYKLCGPPGTTSLPITLRKRDGFGYPARWYQTQGPVYLTIGPYEIEVCDAKKGDAEYERVMAEMNLYEKGRFEDKIQYFGKSEWSYLDYSSVGACKADTRLWYLKPVADGAGVGFVVSGGKPCSGNQICEESFNGKTYNLKKKSVRNKLLCSKTSLLPANTPSFENPPEKPSISFTELRLIEADADSDYFSEPSRQMDKLQSMRCHKAPKKTGPATLVLTSTLKYGAKPARIEVWCNAFRCEDRYKSASSAGKITSTDKRKFMFKKTSVVVKK